MSCYEQRKSEYGVINSIVMELMNIVVPSACDQFPLLKILHCLRFFSPLVLK